MNYVFLCIYVEREIVVIFVKFLILYFLSTFLNVVFIYIFKFVCF
jgi:hypothetical protein